jgi:hydroxymethylbilane synthase
MSFNKSEMIIGSRESQLAMIQSEYVQGVLQAAFTSKSFPIVGMTTTGDQILDVSLNKIGAKSLFTKELEVALEQKKVDLVVHSLKDLPTTLPPGMALAAVMERKDPRDCLIMSKKNSSQKIETLKPGSVLGTSSVRRIAQLSRSYPHLKFMDVV